jgi:hypothetical protein
VPTKRWCLVAAGRLAVHLRLLQPGVGRHAPVPVAARQLEPELIHAGLSLFNSAFYPDASRRVEPVLDALAQAIRLLAG